MRTKLPRELPAPFQSLISRPTPPVYVALFAVSALTAIVWLLFTQLGVVEVNGWLPYHVPVSIFLSAILLILAIRAWVKILLGGEQRATAPQVSSPEPMVSTERAVAKATSGGAPRVLVVDDDELVRMMLCKQLRRLGAEADSAANGLEALHAAERQVWDLILLDGHMPVLGGVEAAREIRNHKFISPDTPIVAITNDQRAVYRERCLSAGMDAFCPKPKRLSEVKTLLDQYGPR